VKALAKKQVTSQEEWLAAREALALLPPPDLEAVVERTVREIREQVRGRKVAFAWSGGKDSLVLEGLMRAVGIKECVLVVTNLEYPAFYAWSANHMPDDLEIINTGQDLVWLKAHPRQLFPKMAGDAAVWMRGVQWAGQTSYFHKHALDMLLTGRRRADGNYVGGGGREPGDPAIYTNGDKVTRYSPLADWSHEHVLAYVATRGIELPPCYGWPRGFRVGTGPWPMRQWCTHEAQGWDEVYSIDPAIVRDAADFGFDGARLALSRAARGGV
jgi:3'-phosphoadenosine 5'-phosphosulfate sulfotransferase (PAPS reductase)/FAD synthetase